MKQQFQFSADAWAHNKVRLVNQTFKLLPMYESGEDWQSQLNTLLMELKGYNSIFFNCSGFMILIGRLSALQSAEDQFSFRKLVFEAISQLQEIEI